MKRRDPAECDSEREHKSVLPWVIFGIGAGLLTVWWLADHRRGIAWARKAIREKFPDIFHITTDMLAEKLSGEPDERPVLLDVRSGGEYEMSHLAGALHLEEGCADEELHAALPADRQVVVYCAAGYRASRMARRLVRLGFRRVANLDGGVFQWANEGREVVRDANPVSEVHPFHRAFARLLHPDRRPAV